MNTKTDNAHYSAFGRWINRRSQHKGRRWFMRFLLAFTVTLFTGISAGTSVFLLSDGLSWLEGLSPNDEPVFSTLPIIQFFGAVIAGIPTTIFALACSFSTARLNIWWNLLLALTMTGLIWLVVGITIGGFIFADSFFAGLIAVSVVSGFLGMSAARGIQVFMLRRVKHIALMAEIDKAG